MRNFGAQPFCAPKPATAAPPCGVCLTAQTAGYSGAPHVKRKQKSRIGLTSNYLMLLSIAVLLSLLLAPAAVAAVVRLRCELRAK